MKTRLIMCALAAALVLVPGTAPGQERLKLIYSQFTMTNSATWFAREAGLFERDSSSNSAPIATRAPRTADPKGFIDMRFVREIEQSGAIDKLYAQTP